MDKLKLNRKEFSNVTFTSSRIGMDKRANTCSLMGTLRLSVGLNVLPLGVAIEERTLEEINPLIESPLVLLGRVELKLITLEGITVLTIKVIEFAESERAYIELDLGYALFRIVSEDWYWKETRVSIEPLLSNRSSTDLIPIIPDETRFLENIEHFMEFASEKDNIGLVLAFDFVEENGVYVGYITITDSEGYNSLLIIESVEESKLHLLTEYLIKQAELHRSVWDKLLVG